MSKNTYPENMNELIPQLVDFLRSRRKTITVEANLDHGAPLFDKPYVTEARTYTRAQVIDWLNNALDYCRNASTGKPHGKLSQFFRNDEPAITGAGAGVLALTQTNRNGKNLITALATAGPRHNTPKRQAMAEFKASQDGADVWTVEGLKGRTFASKSDAIAFGVREVFAEDWRDANSIEDQDVASEERAKLKAQVVLFKNGQPVEQKVKSPKSTQAPTITLTASESKAMAKSMGASASQCKTKAKAIEYLHSRGITNIG